MSTVAATIEHDEVYPRDALHRYRVYTLLRGQLSVLFAAPNPEAVGTGIVQVAEDQRENGEELGDLGAIGILDAVDHHWVLSPFPRAAHV